MKAKREALPLSSLFGRCFIKPSVYGGNGFEDLCCLVRRCAREESTRLDEAAEGILTCPPKIGPGAMLDLD